jgi:hypothetical protein
MGLGINVEKTRYMGMSLMQVKRSHEDIIRDDFKFEEIDRFTHLGSMNYVVPIKCGY